MNSTTEGHNQMVSYNKQWKNYSKGKRILANSSYKLEAGIELKVTIGHHRSLLDGIAYSTKSRQQMAVLSHIVR